METKEVGRGWGVTEVRWLNGTRPIDLLYHLRFEASERRTILFNCACCRRIWHLIDSEDRGAVTEAESNCDDRVALHELDLRLEPEQIADLVMHGLGPPNHEVSEDLRHLLSTRTAIRLRLGGRGYGIGSLANAVAGLTAGAASKDTRSSVHSAALQAEEEFQARLARDIFGNPFRPVTFDPRWRSSNSVEIARTIYEDRAFDRMPILADALMDAGCEEPRIIEHCNGPGPHVRGCWVVDLVLGKE